MLRYKADRRTLAFCGTYFALVALGYGTSLPWPATAALTASIALLSFFCAVISHNVVHAPVFVNRHANRVFQGLVSLTYGHPVSMFVPGHNLSHHRYLQGPRDRMRTDKMRFRWNLLNQLFFNFAIGPAIFRDNAAYARLARHRSPGWYRQFQLELGAYVAFLVLTLALSVWLDGGMPWRFLLFVFLPHQYAVWGIAGINFVQHDGTDPDHPTNHSRNFTSPILNWFTFNNGYHGIHHMRPALHWSLTPEAHARDVVPTLDPRLDQPSLLAYCFKAYVWPGRRLRYDGTPVVLPAPRADEDWVLRDADRGTPQDQGASLSSPTPPDGDDHGRHDDRGGYDHQRGAMA